MSVTTNKIKGRIKSVTGAYKVTSAMKLVSTVKLKKYKGKMLSNVSYISEIKETIDLLVNKGPSKLHSPYLKENEESKKKLFIIISSTLGLCGSYNNNIFKLVDETISKDDDAILLGKKAITKYSDGEFTSVNDFNSFSSINDEEIIKKMSEYILKEYEKKTYKEVILLYSEYKNSLVFLAKKLLILPLKNKEEKEVNNDYPPIFEPSAQTLLDNLVPFYINSLLYSKLLESEVCEHASRSNAMENATENAKEILDNLKLEFNKARQASITQEIVEIVGASESV